MQGEQRSEVTEHPEVSVTHPKYKYVHCYFPVTGFFPCMLIFFFFLSKISPELTSTANPPLFAEEDWP